MDRHVNVITRFAAGGGDLSESLQLLFLRFREERGPFLMILLEGSDFKEAK